MPTRRNLIRVLPSLLAGVAALAACSDVPARVPPRSRRRPTPPPTAAPLSDPEVPLCVASIGTSFGPLARFEAQIALAIEEAAADVNFHGGVFGRDLELADRHVMDAPDEDLAPWVARMRDAGVTALVTSVGDAELLRLLPSAVDAGWAVLSPTSRSSRLRREADDAGLLIRLSPSTRAMARWYAAEALSVSGSDEGPIPGTIGFVGPWTEEADALLTDLHEVLEPLGGAVVTEHRHDVGDIGDTTAVVAAVLAERPALLVVASGPEIAPLLAALHTAELDAHGASAIATTISLGPEATADYSGADLPQGALDGVHGIQPGGELEIAHLAKILARMPELDATPSPASSAFGYVQQAHDALALVALGAGLAGRTEGTAIAHAVGRLLDGEQTCGEIPDCLALLSGSRSQGVDAEIGYTPRSGELTLERNDPVGGKLRRYAFDAASGVHLAEVTDYSPA